MSELSFDALFDEVVGEWPESLDATIAHIQGSDGVTRYTVEALGDLEDALSARHVGTPREILMRGLHDALYMRMHAIAPDIDRLAPAKLNRPVVRAIFERRLREAQLRGDHLDLCPEDHALAQAYFAANPPGRLLAAE